MIPVSSSASGISTPCGARRAGTSLRRPPASTTTSASRVVPSDRVTPTTRGIPSTVSSAVTSEVTERPWISSTAPSASAIRRSTHSKVVRRQARAARSSSPGSGSNSIPSGAISRKRNSVAPASSSAAMTSGWRSHSRLRSRARNAWEWRTWGAPCRSHSKAPCGSVGRGVSSRSTIVTRCPDRAVHNAVPRPPTPAPMITIRATSSSLSTSSLAVGGAVRPRHPCRLPGWVGVACPAGVVRSS